MATRLEHALTTVTQEEMFQAFGSAYLQCMGSTPRREALCLLVAQSAFETGWWKYMHNFNVGNMKSLDGDGRDFTYFRCWEIVPTYSVKNLQAHPKYGQLVSLESSDAKGLSKIWLAPDHPGCRFRAYRTLQLGVFDHLLKLLDRYTDVVPEKDAWAYVVAGDPNGFVGALKAKGYFTGDEAIYKKQVSSIFNLLLQKNWDMTLFQAQPKEEEDEIRNWRITATLRGMAEVLEGGKDDA